jgi:two-component system, OmpR family, alkaline phosphatase synthesis response regulator PhoP
VMKKILIVEDNLDLAFGLRNNLEIEGYAVDVEHEGTSGLSRAREETYDLVLLDLMLPGLHGFHVLRALREDRSRVPILILTALGAEADKVRGLKLGADAYVTKPFGLLELLARVEALLRRSGSSPVSSAEETSVSFGSIEINKSARTVSRSGVPVELTPKEYELLVTLLRQAGSVVTRLQLMRDVWGYSDSVITRTVDTHIAELRRKLEDDPADPRYTLTARKVGYRLQR